MIKKYNQYIKESLLNKLEGPSIDDVKQNISNINTNKLFKISIDNNDLELIKLIFEKKSFISFADKTYVMDLACEKNLYDIVHYLRNTQRIQIDLQIAAQFNDIKLFDIAEETSQYYNISEVFESALCYGNIDIIKYLLNKHKITKGVVKTAIKYVGKMFLSDDTENKKIKTIEYLFSIYDFTIEELKDINVLNYNVRNEINKEINKKKLTESLLNNLSSYSDEEAYQNLLDKYNNNIDDVIFVAARVDFLYGVKKALEEIEKYGNSGINYPNLIITDTIIYGSMEVLKYLIEEEGADINGYYGHNLEAAASNDHPEIIKYLLSKGADVHVNGEGPLWKAMSKGYVECAKYLLEGGAKLEQYMVNVVDKKNKPMLDLLKKYVVKESLLDKISGPTEEEVKSTIDNLPSPTQRLIKSIDAEYIDGIKNALNNGAEIKNINVDYVAKLIQLLNLNNDEIKDLLKDESKVSIFKIAVTLNNLELVKEYGIYGSGVIHLGQDFPIRHAINNNYYDIVEYLFSMDDFKPSVLNTMVEITSDKKMIKLIMLHLRNSQLHSLMHMCKTKQLNMISIILRIYSFTKEGIEKCIEETDDEDVLFLLKNKLNTL